MSIYAIGDIHGHYDELINLLKFIQYDENKDSLYFVGDYFDRGEQNYEMFQWISDNIDKPNIHFTIGNHDDMMAKAVKDDFYRFSIMDFDAGQDWRFNGGISTYDALLDIPDSQRQYVLDKLLSCHNYSHEVECNGKIFHIVHAGVPSLYDRMSEVYPYFYDIFVWIREDFYLEPLTPRVKDNEYVLVGHTPVSHIWNNLNYYKYELKQFEDFPFDRENDPDRNKKVLEFDHKIMIDTGCGRGEALSAYRLDDGKSFCVDCNNAS